ncbi:hypothetical protein ETE46_01135 [Escherichia coli]|nr:hypothetical protein ETE46_01135 [Escherichia coli]
MASISIRCPSCSATEGVVRNGKSTAGHQRYLLYDGDFKVLAWLPFPSDVLPAPLLKAWCVTAKALPDISAISALIAVKHGNYSSLTPPLSPVRTRKSLIWP